MPPLVRSLSVSITEALFGKPDFQPIYSFNHSHILQYPWRFGEVNFVVSLQRKRESFLSTSFDKAVSLELCYVTL
jgi:hypothetical protein